MSPLRLWLIAEHFHPTLSGASERMRRYLPRFRERDIEPQVFTILQDDLESQEVVDGIPIHRLALPDTQLHPSAELTKQVLRHLKANDYKPHVVHILSHTLQGIPYLWQMRLLGIACVHSITMDQNPPFRSVAERAKIMLHQSLRYSPFNEIIVSSETVAESARRFGIASKRLTIIANGVDTRRFNTVQTAEEKQNLRLRFGFAPDDKIVLFVGYISKRKGVDLLLEAWPTISTQHPQAKLLLIGPQDRKDQFTEFFDQQMRQLQHEGNVQYLPPVPNIETYMQISDLLVLPSRLEGMPNVVVEGMSCGLPCVLTPFKGLPAVFGEPGVDYILTQFSPEQIAADINDTSG